MVSFPKDTRAKILDYLQGRSCCAGHIAEQFGISRVAAHRHLDKLMQDGLLGFTMERCEGKGRPKQTYHAVESKEISYEKFSTEILKQVRNLFGSKGVEEVFNEYKKSLESTLSERLEGVELPEKMDRLSEALSELGYQAAVHIENGELILEQKRCPAQAVAEKNTEICKCENHMYSRLLGENVISLQTISKGGDSCKYKIEFDQGSLRKND